MENSGHLLRSCYNSCCSSVFVREESANVLMAALLLGKINKFYSCRDILGGALYLPIAGSSTTINPYGTNGQRLFGSVLDGSIALAVEPTCTDPGQSLHVHNSYNSLFFFLFVFRCRVVISETDAGSSFSDSITGLGDLGDRLALSLLENQES